MFKAQLIWDVNPIKELVILTLPMKKIKNIYSEKYGVTHPTKPGLKIPQMFEAAINKDLKAVWIIGEDIVQTDPNSAHVIEAMESLEFLVVQEIFMSETAKLATVVLARNHFLRKRWNFYKYRKKNSKS